MAWKDAWSYAGKILGKEEASNSSTHQEAHREDAHLPMAAQIGSVVTLQKTPFIRAQSQGSLVVMPDDDETLITAISRINTNMQGALYRYYLNTGDKGSTEKFLQLYVNDQQEVIEVLFCSRLCRLIPESVEDQEAYSGDAGYGLGDQSYTIWREQVLDLGFDEASLHACFADQDSIIYQRDAGDVQLAFMPPFRGVETRIDNAAGTEGLQQTIIFMPYARALGGESENQREVLLISTEIIESENGDRRKRGIYVDFMIGIPIELERLVVQ